MSEERFKGEMMITNPRMHTVVKELTKAMSTKISEEIFKTPTDKEVSEAFKGMMETIKPTDEWKDEGADDDGYLPSQTPAVDMKELIKDL